MIVPTAVVACALLAGRWSDWTQFPAVGAVNADRLLMVVAVILLQLVTGKELVRLVLASVGAVKPAGEPQPSDRLRGGRLLGPMERPLILGLGLAGQLAAATVVVVVAAAAAADDNVIQVQRQLGNILPRETRESKVERSSPSSTSITLHDCIPMSPNHRNSL